MRFAWYEPFWDMCCCFVLIKKYELLGTVEHYFCFTSTLQMGVLLERDFLMGFPNTDSYVVSTREDFKSSALM